MKNLEIMKKVSIEQCMDAKFIKILIDDEVLSACNEALRILDPVCKMLNTFQKKETTLGEAVQKWLEYIESAGPLELPTILKRIKKSDVLGPVGLCANLLNPKFKGIKFSQEQMTVATNYIIASLNSTESCDALKDYLDSAGIYQNLINCNPSTFWYFAKGNKDLSDLGAKMSTIPAGTAQLERLFSNWGEIHSKLRNRLTDSRSEKLVYIYFSHKVATYDSIPLTD